jgi:hypothetical protein
VDGFCTRISFGNKYKKGIHNKVADMLLRPVINASTILMYNPLAHEIYVEQYSRSDDFKYVYDALNHNNQHLDYYMNDILLYHLGKLCIQRDERVSVIKEDHTYIIYGHFGVGNIVAQLQRYCYWPRMNETISRYIKWCVVCHK